VGFEIIKIIAPERLIGAVAVTRLGSLYNRLINVLFAAREQARERERERELVFILEDRTNRIKQRGGGRRSRRSR